MRSSEGALRDWKKQRTYIPGVVDQEGIGRLKSSQRKEERGTVGATDNMSKKSSYRKGAFV